VIGFLFPAYGTILTNDWTFGAGGASMYNAEALLEELDVVSAETAYLRTD